MPILINWRGWLALGLSALLAFAGYQLHHDGYLSGKAEVMAAWSIERAAVAAQSLKLSEQAARETSTLQLQADQTMRSKDEKIRTLNAAVSAVVASLHDRADRPAGGIVPEVASVGGGCTGAGLYRADGEFLAREAARADAQRLQLDACQTQYSAAREALK